MLENIEISKKKIIIVENSINFNKNGIKSFDKAEELFNLYDENHLEGKFRELKDSLNSKTSNKNLIEKKENDIPLTDFELNELTEYIFEDPTLKNKKYDKEIYIQTHIAEP
ncbi:hypothetical protein BB561_002946 [Smittium simulii]|uniref:Uncharacterized protein n=1 Tax=Smittium simulii TaxID=133385 RepID=A0A2T9YNH9_9FUNG|nr:hypothetical protein BB561_002946 [Smittium simulii]